MRMLLRKLTPRGVLRILCFVGFIMIFSACTQILWLPQTVKNVERKDIMDMTVTGRNFMIPGVSAFRESKNLFHQTRTPITQTIDKSDKAYETTTVATMHPAGAIIMLNWTDVKSAKNEPEVGRKSSDGCYLGKYCVNYIFKPKDLCRENVDTKLVIFVLSSMENCDRRKLIRQTWANKSIFKDTEVRVLFILGKGENYTTLENQVHDEAYLENDIVLVDFNDTYGNLTLKTLLGLHWTIHFCPKARFVLKTDDNVFVNTFGFLYYVTEVIQRKLDKEVIGGHIMKDSKVLRAGKYWVSKAQYAGNRYPVYCIGPGYLLSMDVVHKLNDLALTDNSSELLRMEDVYITGILAERAKIRPYQMNAGGWTFAPRTFFKQAWKNYFIWHNSMNVTEEIAMWDSLLGMARLTHLWNIP